MTETFIRQLAVSYLVKIDFDKTTPDDSKILMFKYRSTMKKLDDLKLGKAVESKHIHDDLTDPRIYVYEYLSKIGIGIKNYKKYYTNFTKINDITKLTRKQIHIKLQQYILTNDLPKKIMLNLMYPQMNVPIKRSIIDDFDKFLKEHAELKYEIVGSYRRKTPFSNDIDIIVKRSIFSDATSKDFSNKIFTDLKNIGIVEKILSLGPNKMTLIIKFDNRPIQLDIVITPLDEYIPTLIYFTGNKYYNIYLRKALKRHGYSLSEHGLFKHTKKISIKANTEKKYINELSKIADVKYLLPEERSQTRY